MRIRVFGNLWISSLVVLLVAFGCVVTPAMAAAADDASVRGSVIDPLGAVVVGAKVELLRDGAVVTQSVTDAQGRYAFDGLTGGWYVLAASADGFERVQGAPLLLKGGVQAAVPLMLQVGTLRQDIVVTASASSVSAAQVGAPVTVLDRQALERLGSTELLDPLRTVPGVAVVQAGQRGGLTSLFVRGGSSNFNKVLIDGIAANEMGGAVDFSNMSTSGIERVEVLRAANSVAYGSDAMTGVVDITTRRGTTRLPEGTLSADGGNLGTAHTDLSVGGVASDLNYFVSYSRLQSDNSVPNAEYRNNTLSTRVGARVGRHTDVSGTVRWFDSSAGSPNATNYYGIADDSTSDATSSFATVSAR